MDWHSPWFWIAALGIFAVFHLELIADFLNLSRLNSQSDLPQEEHARMVEYNIASTRMEMLRRTFSVGVLVLFWFCGGFGWLDDWSRGWGFDAVKTGVLLIAVITVAQQLLSLPFEVWDTFGIEARFGFNRTTPATFLADRIKGAVLMALIGLPVLWLIVWFFETQRLAALWAWLSVTVFSVLMSFLAPRLIMPLFMKFQPLGNDGLRQSILDLSRRLEFPVGEVSVVDGSRRSTKANAFFAGFGKAKRIALFDTLIASHSQEQILAVLAHEIGHFKRRHVIQQMVFGLAQMGVMFALLHFAMQSPSLFHAFGVSTVSAGMGLVLFSIVYRPLSMLLEVWQLGLSRRHEFEADAYASQAMGRPVPLIDALGRLSREHLAHPAPHPFYVAMHYSHPPVAERMAALARS